MRWHNNLDKWKFPVSFLIIGIFVSGIIFYLTPLKHLNFIEPIPRKISPTEFYEKFGEDPSKYLLIDIRSEEFRAQEYPEGSIYTPLNTLVGEVNALPRNKSIVIFCESNFSASAAYHVLQNNGFLDVQIIDGGRTTWKRDGLPLVQGLDEQKKIANDVIYLKSKLLKR